MSVDAENIKQIKNEFLVEKLKSEGNKYFSEANFEKAFESFSEALNCCEDKNKIAVLYSNRANTLIKLNKLDEALIDCEKSISLNPNWYKGYYRKGQILFMMKNKEEAEESFKNALKFTNNDNDNVEERNEIEKCLENINKDGKGKKNLFKLYSDSDDNNNHSCSKNKAEEEIQNQVDFLMSQFIKPNEDDAFRSLSVYHGVADGDLSKENAESWIKFGNKYGYGDSEQLFLALQKYFSLTLIDDDEEEGNKNKNKIKAEFYKIVDLCGL